MQACTYSKIAHEGQDGDVEEPFTVLGSPNVAASRTSSCLPRKPLPNSPAHYDQNQNEQEDTDVGDSKVLVARVSEEVKSSKAESLRSPLHQTILRTIVDVFMVTLPCLFIALGVVATRLNQQEKSSYGEKVKQAARLGPTVFPIAFAAIVARFNRQLARWQAEKGQCLGVRV